MMEHTNPIHEAVRGAMLAEAPGGGVRRTSFQRVSKDLQSLAKQIAKARTTPQVDHVVQELKKALTTLRRFRDS